ncbi:MAG: hypothetical protein HY290_03075 [Planctomycetia bacterium]|nr:hypothetical protein [Planctomycetia bacterium]
MNTIAEQTPPRLTGTARETAAELSAAAPAVDRISDCAAMATLTGAAVTSIIAASAWLLVWGTTVASSADILRLCGIGYFLCLVPLARIGANSPKVIATSSLVILFLLTALGIYCGDSFVSYVGWGFAAAGWIGACLMSWRWLHLIRSQPLAVLPLTLVCWIFVNQAWAIRNPLVIEGISARADLTFPDPIYQSSLAASLATYHRASGALDGTPHTAYHFATNVFLAALARLSDLPPLYATVIGFPIVMLGALLAHLFWFSEFLAGAVVPAQARWYPRQFAPLLGVCAFGTAAILPAAVYTSVVIAPSYFHGENTAFALVLFFNLTIVLIAELNSTDSPLRTGRFVLLACAATALIALAKTHLVHIALGLLWYSAIRSPKGRRALLLSAIGASIVYACLAAYLVEHGRSGDLYVMPLGFMSRFIALDAWGLYIAIAMLWPAVYLILACRQKRIASAGQLWSEIRARTMFDVELACVVGILAVLPGMALGGHHSFHTFQYPYVAANLMLPACMALWGRCAPAPAQTGWRDLSLAALGWRTVAALLLATCLANLAIHSKELLWRNIQDRGGHAATPLGIPDESGKKSLRVALRGGRISEFRSLLTENTKLHEEMTFGEGTIWHLLRTVEQLPSHEKRHSLLYIPRDNEFWKSVRHVPPTEIYQRRYLGYVAVGLSSVALLDGGPLEDLSDGRAIYGLAQFSPARYQDESPGDQQLIAHAARLGFEQVLYVESGADRHCSIRKLEVGK